MTSKKSKTKKVSKPRPSSKPRDAARMSALDAAARVLKESGQPMNCMAMVEKMLSKGYWKTSGATPAATLSSAILREVKNKGKESRFKKEGRGQFSLA